ncbi:unnamed protein product [marine sediment metagenome]|uniref:Uncharacterized protein n=1 Tax=marine sediment metagenome TaxID=412755 RepID=X1LJI7_9ZZZZ
MAEERVESLRERVDHQLGISLDVERKSREIACYLVHELLPSEDKTETEAEKKKETPEPQGWFEEILHRLNELREIQRVAAYNFVRLRKAVITGLVKKAG